MSNKQIKRVSGYTKIIGFESREKKKMESGNAKKRWGFNKGCRKLRRGEIKERKGKRRIKIEWK